jgi:HK97 family phage major capsid protein
MKIERRNKLIEDHANLLEQRSTLLARANELAQGEPDQDVLARLEAIVLDIKNLDSRLTALETELAADAAPGESVDSSARSIPQNILSAIPKRENRRIPSGPEYVSNQGKNDMNETNDLALRAFLRCGTSSEKSGDRDLVMRSGAINPQMMEFRAGLDSAPNRIHQGPGGGSLVPVSLLKNYVLYLKHACRWLDFCKVISTTSGERLEIPVSADAISENSLAEGWTEQLKKATDKDPVLSQVYLDAWTCQSGLVSTSWELVADSGVNLGELLGQILGERIGRNLDLAFASGNGIDRPHGVLNAITSDNTVTSTASGSIAADDLLSLIGKIDAAYSVSGSAAFVMHPSTMIALRKLKASGTGEYLFESNAQSGQPERIFGYPVYLSSAIPSLAGNNLAIVFGDFSRYLIRQAQAVTVRKSDDFRFDQRATTWMAYARFDGKVSDPTAFAALRIKA